MDVNPQTDHSTGGSKATHSDALVQGIETRVTSQGQVSVPAAIRKALGVAPGSKLQWILKDGEVIVKKRGGASLMDIHKALFPNGLPKGHKPVSLRQMDEAIADYIREKHGRR